ncbi:MAG: LruC domain-containing protein [Bacteroidetes bacterium]|nr:LruC domain-containing protein [Bacteroidota bacterium]MBU1579707.1 LruC domain-containing protein [Bacteroidota bacterium]MBU2558578.1 LruC domain-containing protein [Bacteroidota bacterium]
MKKNSYLKILLILIITSIATVDLSAQSAITEISATTSDLPDSETYSANGATNSGLSGNTYTYKFGAASGFNDNQLSLDAFEADGLGYRYEGVPVEVFFRRVDNGNVTGVRDLLFYFGEVSGSTFKLKAPYESNMETAFTGNTNLRRGSDNLFSNGGDGNGNNNNIERLDVVVSAGIELISAEGQGYALMERGGQNQHDAFVTAVILSVDGAGNPTSYSNVIRVGSADYGTTNPIPNQESVVLRRDGTTEVLKTSTTLGPQGIGGIMFKFSDFGLTDGQTVYGYSVAAADFPNSGGAADMVDYTNTSYFPLTTNGTTAGQGGIDMIALTGIVREISISGNVFNDISGLTNNLVDGDPIAAVESNELYVNLVNELGKVVQSVAVAADGSYGFDAVPLGELKLQLSLLEGTPGDNAPAINLIPEWAYVSDKAGTGATPQNNDGEITIFIGAQNVSGLDFGIQKRPVAETTSLSPQQNPGGTVFVTVPATSFGGADFDGGTVTDIRIDSYPIGAEAIKIDGVTYDFLSFPAAGITIPANLSGEPEQSIEIDPADGDLTVTISYYTIDNAGYESSLPGQVNVPFTSAPIIIENNYPATGYGTLAYEDLWPGKGDYDFNDMVIDYRFVITANGNNMIESVAATFILKAFGASYENGFGFQLSEAIDAADLTVTGYELTEDIITLDGNGTEAGQSKPTIIVFDNAYNQMAYPGTGIGVNTTPEATYVTPDTMNILINFASNQYDFNDLDIANFNPFIIVNLNREVEVHLPDYLPTDLADQSLFGQWEDASNPATAAYYKTANNLPWAINIYESFDYPIEKQEIIWAHLKFAEWATSGGVLFPNWYQNISGFRNDALIYEIP